MLEGNDCFPGLMVKSFHFVVPTFVSSGAGKSCVCESKAQLSSHIGIISNAAVLFHRKALNCPEMASVSTFFRNENVCDNAMHLFCILPVPPSHYSGCVLIWKVLAITSKGCRAPCTVNYKYEAGWLQFVVFPFSFAEMFRVQLLSEPRRCELQVDTAGEEFLDPLMCDFWWTRMNVMYMQEKTPIKEGATIPGKSHHYFFETHSNFDKGHESNQTLRQGQEKKLCVCMCACVCELYPAQQSSETVQQQTR